MITVKRELLPLYLQLIILNYEPRTMKSFMSFNTNEFRRTLSLCVVYDMLFRQDLILVDSQGNTVPFSFNGPLHFKMNPSPPQSFPKNDKLLADFITAAMAYQKKKKHKYPNLNRFIERTCEFARPSPVFVPHMRRKAFASLIESGYLNKSKKLTKKGIDLRGTYLLTLKEAMNKSLVRIGLPELGPLIVTSFLGYTDTFWSSLVPNMSDHHAKLLLQANIKASFDTYQCWESPINFYLNAMTLI